MKNILTFLIILAWLPGFGQDIPKKIYFYADTSNNNASNKVIDIGRESNIFKVFTIYCPCLNKANAFTSFIHVTKKGEIKPAKEKKKPNHSYISFKDLAERLAKYGENFDQYYELHIIERLRKNQYISWKVEILPGERMVQ